jgi:tRNA1(Val) A37 N6-methylase TrmN6
MDWVCAWLKYHFPYKQYSLTLQDAKKMRDNLLKYKPLFVPKSFSIGNLEEYPAEALLFGKEPCLLVNFTEFYSNYNVIVDYFQDGVRMTAKRSEAQYSPLEQWQNETDKFVALCLEKYGEINAYNLRETVYELARECTEFKPSIMAAFILKFKPWKILDFSAGRGARLIGAIAMGVDYVGVDPDPRAIAGCQRIITELAPAASKGHYEMIRAPFQKVPLEQLPKVDMVFTSPPYFKLEEYNKDPDQSTVEFPTLDEWLEGFLYPSLAKAWECLEPDGLFILNLNDMSYSANPRYKFTRLAIKKVNTLPGARFLGVIGSGEIHLANQPHAVVVGRNGQKNINWKLVKVRAPQPFWIWQKK